MPTSNTKVKKIKHFHDTRSITQKRVTNWRAHLSVIAPAGNTAPFEEISQR